MWGTGGAPTPPFGAVFTYSVKADLPPLDKDEKLVLNITDDTGKQVRRLDLDKTPGLRRIAWNLRGEAPATPGGGPQFGGGRCRGGNPAPLGSPGRDRAPPGPVPGDKGTAARPPQTFSAPPVGRP